MRCCTVDGMQSHSNATIDAIALQSSSGYSSTDEIPALRVERDVAVQRGEQAQAELARMRSKQVEFEREHALLTLQRDELLSKLRTSQSDTVAAVCAREALARCARCEHRLSGCNFIILYY